MVTRDEGRIILPAPGNLTSRVRGGRCCGTSLEIRHGLDGVCVCVSVSDHDTVHILVLSLAASVNLAQVHARTTG